MCSGIETWLLIKGISSVIINVFDWSSVLQKGVDFANPRHFFVKIDCIISIWRDKRMWRWHDCNCVKFWKWRLQTPVIIKSTLVQMKRMGQKITSIKVHFTCTQFHRVLYYSKGQYFEFPSTQTYNHTCTCDKILTDKNKTKTHKLFTFIDKDNARNDESAALVLNHDWSI